MEKTAFWTKDDFQNFIVPMVDWFGQFSLKFRLKDDKILFIDPYNLPDNFSVKSDWVMISHDHFDHLSFDDLKKVANPDTPIYAPKKVAQQLKEKGYKNIIETEPFMNFSLGGIVDVYTTPMYNVVKDFHKKEDKWTGFLLTIDDVRIYITSDTERIEEMKDIETDVIFLPLGQVYTMNSIDEALQVVLDTKAKFVVPVHFGLYEGTNRDAVDFCVKVELSKLYCFILPYRGKEPLK